MPAPKKKVQIVKPIDGQDSDTHPTLLSSTKASWLKNVELVLNKGAEATSGVMTPAQSTFSNFNTNLLPATRTFQVDFSGIPAAFILWGYSENGTETVLNISVANSAQLDTIMGGIGWTKVSTGIYQITSTSLWQYFGFGTGGATFGSFLTCVVISRGALTGQNICIGTHYERTVNLFLWLNYNTAGQHQIQMYDATTNVYTTVVESPLLNFDYNHRISSTDLVIINNIQDGSTNYLFYWVDNFSGNRKINLQRAISGEYFNNFPLRYTTPDQWLSNEKLPSYTTIINPTLQLDTNFQENFIANNSFQFAYYYGYDDGETSTLSDYTTLLYTTDYLNPPFNTMPNFIELAGISAGAENVYFVVLCFRIGNTGDWNSFQTIYRKDIVAGQLYTYDVIANTFTYNFYNNQTYTDIQATPQNNNYSLVPIRSGAQRFITNNILIYGDNTEGYNNLTAAQRAVPTIDITYTALSASPYLELIGSVTFHWTASGNGNFTVSLIHASATGLITITSESAQWVNTQPSDLVWVFGETIYNFSAGDKLYIETTAYTNSAGVVNAQAGRHFSGAYSNVTPSGNGDFSVQGTGANGLTLGSNVSFDNIISDPQSTWSTVTNEDTIPNTTATISPQLKQGGTYKFGFILYDYLNRSTFVQASAQLELQIRNIVSTGGNSILGITWFWNGLVFPDWVKKVAICRTQNLAVLHEGGVGQSKYIQWQVEGVTYLDANNNTVPAAAATKVEFNLSSLTTFDSNNFNITNTSYTFTQGDIVRFMTIGGRVFPSLLIERQLRNNNTDLNFIVDMDANLLGFTNGDIVELYTPNNTASADIYYEITPLMTLTGVTGNNQATTQTFTLNTFDTYLIDRSTYCPIPSPANVTFNLFESPYRSDVIVGSWGEDTGRTNTVNNNASQIERQELVRYSLVYIQGTFINGLASFLTGNSVQGDSNFGAIRHFVCIKNVLHWFQEDNVMYSLIAQSITFLQNGQPQYLTGDEVISKPQDTLGDYGCQDPETIVEKDNFVYFRDLKRGVDVEYKTNYTYSEKPTQVPISRKGIAGWTLDQCTFIRRNRGTGLDKIQVQAGLDPRRLKYYISSFKFTATDPYIDLSEQFDNGVNRTTAYHIGLNLIAGSYGFTPEYYGYIDAGLNGLYMVSFKQGIPYFHFNELTTDYLNFYGDNRDTEYIEVVCNRDPKDIEETELRTITYGQSVKNFFSIGYDSTRPDFYASGVPYSAVSVITSNGQTSSIPIASFAWREGFYYSPFYLNTSTGKTIFTGEKLKGTYLTIRLKRSTDPLLRNIYNEVGKIVFYINESAKTI